MAYNLDYLDIKIN